MGKFLAKNALGFELVGSFFGIRCSMLSAEWVNFWPTVQEAICLMGHFLAYSAVGLVLNRSISSLQCRRLCAEWVTFWPCAE